MTAPVRRIVILGGGTAGWSAAACLAKFGADHDIAVTLIDSADIATVGVGEASVPNIRNFNAYVGLDERTFLQATQGTFKLGIEFRNWGAVGTSFFHPFGRYGVDLGDAEFHQCLARARQGGYRRALEAFSLPAALARSGRFSQPVDDGRTPLSNFGYAYHFDASLYAKALRGIALGLGVQHVDGKVVSAHLDADSGDVTHLVTAEGKNIVGDLFVDCSGFRGLIIDKVLGARCEDWSRWLMCDRAVAIPSEVSVQAPMTISTAQDCGWTWSIPLRHRQGNGYVYCSEFINDNEALSTLTAGLNVLADAKPNFIAFKAGSRRDFWVKNCVALGLASGFLEPLESTSINLVHRALSTLLEYFPLQGTDARLQTVANRRMRLETENIRDFIILHYAASQRRDTPFWRACTAPDLPESLQIKIDAFRAGGHLLQYEAESFKPESWLTLFEGLQIHQEAVQPSLARTPPEELYPPLDAMCAAIARAVQSAVSHDTILRDLDRLTSP